MVSLRPITLDDCTRRYVDWLNDPEVNRFLETRWQVQTLASIKNFVMEQITNEDVRMMAITLDDQHIGNLKIGPVNRHHGYGDLSYFIGERSLWGKGYATKAVELAVSIAFNDLKLHRLQAGIYARNQASERVLIRNGFAREGTLHNQLKTELGWDHHILYGRTQAQL